MQLVWLVPNAILKDTEVEVVFSGAEGKQVDVISETDNTSQKVLASCIIKQGMNLKGAAWRG